ncbi:glycoside hydrolase family 28 protein [Kibdelosporangium phytohabitans]|uniref:Glycoside hydrolase n=1 Tax=Kibdelosporangium phytohabitans TaxID=860235 RepID=A0A0N9HLR1_9PSEU|nr:glycoside hydrolase family 28 protein [Kibdelosporangium phytohabitans]ALG07308.1 glycoside hydrolase [Kibdelosporangium phytohabitans]MBE1471825.1 polygalacturonase [Kibdelosporangium phytohabitans]
MSSSRHTRRDVLRGAGLAAGGLLTGTGFATQAAAGVDAAGAKPPDQWRLVPHILGRIRPPTFPARVFPITSYGAVGDGRRKNTAAINDAIEDCGRSGGGRVLVPAGTFVTGGIRMRSGVDLHVAEGAMLKFSNDPKDFLPLVLVRWEGTLCYNYQSFIYAHRQENMAITGSGTIDGDAPNGPWPGWGAGSTPELRKMGEDGVPVEQRIMGEGKRMRPNMIQFVDCRNLLVRDVHLRNPAMWTLHPVFCTNVTVRNVHIHSTNSQGDGVDLDSTSYAHVAGSRFDTNDDCVVLKSGRDADGRRIGIPTSFVVVERCKFAGRWGGITVGSESSGGVHDVFCRDCEVNPPDFPGRYPVKHALYIKTNSDRGGVVDGVHLRNIKGRNVEREVLYASMYYNGGGSGKHYPTLKNLTVDGMTVTGGRKAIHLDGLPESNIRDVTITNSDFTGIAEKNTIRNTGNVVLRGVRVNGEPVG